MISQDQPVHEAVCREWTSAAAGWRKWQREFAMQSQAATNLLVESACITPGMWILDLASGSGEPAIFESQATGVKGRVLATDLVPGMLVGAREYAEQSACPNVAFLAANAEALPFPSGVFDRVTCRFGVMFFSNAGQAMREVRRVLKPSGRTAFVAWGESQHNTFYTSTTDVLVKYAVTPPRPDLARRFAEPGSLSAVLRDAAFQQIVETFHAIAWPWPGTPETFWDYSMEVRTSFRRIFETLSPDQQQRAKQESLAEMRRYYDGRHLNFSGQIVVVSAAAG